MKLTYNNGLFILDALPHENTNARAAGFSWDKDLKKWTTKHSTVARKVCVDGEQFELVERVRKIEEAGLKRSSMISTSYMPPCPEGLAYLPYQRAGIENMIQMRSILLADPMGLGKTIQAIGLCNVIRPLDILIVSPATLKRNWINEWRKWTTIPKEVHPTIGMAEGSTYPSNTNIVVINYDILAKHEKEIKSKHWDMLILDEVHYLKTKKSNRSQIVFGGRKFDKKAGTAQVRKPIQAKVKLALTGTPILNRPIELFPVLHYLDPAAWPDMFDFARRYCQAKQTRFGWDFTGASNLEELQLKLRSTIMIRRDKAEVLKDLPKKVRQIIEIDCDGRRELLRREKFIYPWLKTFNAEKLDEQGYREVVQGLKSGKQVHFEEVSTLRRLTAEAKVDGVIEHLKECIESSGKVICFAHHKEMIFRIKEAFSDICVVVDGSTPLSDRQLSVERFQKDPFIKLFIGNIQAAGVGITLTASSHVVFAELSWVPGEVSQCEDRAHRIGQKDSVLVQHIVLEDSLDAIMAKTIVYKQGVIEAALDNDPHLSEALK